MGILESLTFLFGEPTPPRLSPLPKVSEQPEPKPEPEFPLGTYRLCPCRNGYQLGFYLQEYKERRNGYEWSFVRDANDYDVLIFDSEELAEFWIKEQKEMKKRLEEHLAKEPRIIRDE